MKPFVLFSSVNAILFCLCAFLWSGRSDGWKKKKKTAAFLWILVFGAVVFCLDRSPIPSLGKLFLLLLAITAEVSLIHRHSVTDSAAFSFVFLSSLSLAEFLFLLAVRVISGVDFLSPDLAHGSVFLWFLILLGALCLAGFRKERKESAFPFLRILLCLVFFLLLENTRLFLINSSVADGVILGVFSFLLAIGLAHTLLRSHRQKIAEDSELSAELAFHERYLSEAKDHLQQVSRILHDFKKHLRVLEGILPAEPQQAKEYLSRMSDDFQDLQPLCFTGNPAVDATLSHYRKEAEDRGISLAIHAQYPSNCKITDKDICAVLFNVLENAVKATEAERVKEIDFSMKIIRSMLVIKCTNPCSQVRKEDHSLFHGHGLPIIRSIAQRYSGSMQTERKNGIFETLVYLCP